MKLASWACCAISLLIGLTAVVLAQGTSPSGVQIQHFEAAVHHVVPLGPQLPEPGVVRPDLSEPGWTPVALPVVTPRQLVSMYQGPRQWHMHWYHVRYVLPPRGASPALAVYAARVQGGPVEVHVNDRLLLANRYHWGSQWNRPLYVQIPADVVFTSPGVDVVIDVVVGVPLRDKMNHSLATLWVGPADEVRAMADRRTLAHVTGPQVTSLTILVLGLFSFGVWWRRRRESAYLLFALASTAWWVRNLHYHVDLPRSGPVHDWFWWLTNASMSWVMVLTYLFALRFHNRRYRKVEWLLVGFTLLSTLLTIPPLPGDPLVLQQALNALVSIFVTAFITWIAVRHQSRELRLLTATLWVGIALGIHDLLLVSLRITPESAYLMPYATLLVFGAFLYAVLRRYSGAIEEVEQINASLEHRLAQRTSELEDNHRRLRAVEREQALLLERQRLMRDMHDGMGSALMSSLVLVEQGKLDLPSVAQVLRECVDDLRLVIDSLEPIGHDLVTLLATLRYRLGKRLEAAGLQLEWQVDDLPPLPWLDPTAALQVLRIVQEALTNILKHARARKVRIALRKAGQQVEVDITDDGLGFDVAAMTANSEGGRGLRNLRKRAQGLGGDVLFTSQAGHTQVTLVLPIEREAEPVTGK
ncbi:sensor histidine kinase [Caldimonas brevitalea]|uniref:histidine kinase n=1 Tax=Caldimonas brevitalea TaxID=413882 RepID=A0A0G3BK48_9BURK|nr:sensor histidine kinase [Caldimonas brevitalea]AKJ26920.1 two-component system sensor kinase [Caldimonas brevitalea]